MRVLGKKIDKELALEIIRRTDSVFSGFGGNDRDFNLRVWNKCQCPMDDQFRDSTGTMQWASYEAAKLAWEKHWGFIRLEYIDNHWVSCSWANGTHGWCHPDGTIHFADNVGKWPKTIELYDEWRMLARRFPFLSLGVTLMSHESMEEVEESKPLVSLLVEGGKVKLVDPKKEDVLARFGQFVGRSKMTDKELEYWAKETINGTYRHEKAIPFSTISKWAKQFNYKEKRWFNK